MTPLNSTMIDIPDKVILSQEIRILKEKNFNFNLVIKWSDYCSCRPYKMSADASARLCQQLRHAKSSECGDHVSKFSSVCVQKGFIRFLSGWTGCSQLSHFCIWEENRTKMCHPFEFEWTNICPSAKCRMHNGVNNFEVGLFVAKNCQIYTFSVLFSLEKTGLLQNYTIFACLLRFVKKCSARKNWFKWGKNV